MKLQSQSSRTLAQALSTVAKCISNKNTMAILDHALLRKVDGKFLLTGASQDSQLTLSVELHDCDGDFTKACLPAGELIAYLSTLPDVPVSLSFTSNGKDGGALTLEYCTQVKDHSKSGQVQFAYFNAEEYPIMAQHDEDICHIVLPADVFLTHINAAVPFTANDELRMVLNCVCIDVKLDNCIIVGTNGQTLYRYTHGNGTRGMGTDFQRSNTEATILFHKNHIKAITAFSGAEEVEIHTDGRSATVKTDTAELIVKLVEGRFPNYNSVIPVNNPYYVALDSKELSQVIKRVSMCAAEATGLVAIEPDGMFLNVKAEDIDFSKSATDQALITSQQCDQKMRIGIKGSHLQQIISAIGTPDLRIEFSDPSRALIVRPDDPNSPIITLLMPMLLQA